ncbi:MAG: hypothetical protein AB7T18_12535 [Alphaproteobacteria bacterium]
MRVLGFVDFELIAVLDQEWQDYPGNEADRLFEYAETRRLFSSVKSVFLWGAGACRLADYLGSLEFVDRVDCSDLSWPALNFGRAFIEARHAELPEPLTRHRVFYHAGENNTDLVRTTRPSRFKAPMTPPDRRQRIRYTVRDAFAPIDDPIAADLIVVPYLLDIFGGAQCISLLLRICQHIRAGQQIVILVTCTPEGRAGPGRDPGLIMDALQGCGFEFQFVDLVLLPYSFSYYSYGRKHTDWTTLVVRAERVRERDDGIVIARSERGDAFLANRANTANPRGPSNPELILERTRGAENYRSVAAALAPRMGLTEFENAVGELASRGLINLRIDPS